MPHIPWSADAEMETDVYAMFDKVQTRQHNTPEKASTMAMAFMTQSFHCGKH